MIDSILGSIRRLIPSPVFNFFQPIYHWKLSLLAALWYRFPSRKIKVIAVTGTKGKSSTVEILNAILEEAGYRTALSNTIRFKIADESSPNLYKMTMPGRFFMQRFLRKAVDQKCDYAILEMTSQGVLTYRHLFIDIDALIFTNLAPEHIEAHGSYENYIASKVTIAKRLGKSRKQNRTLIVNADDKEGRRFLECIADRKITYSIDSAKPYNIKREGLEFGFEGKVMHSHLSGLFNLYNILAAATAARSQGVSLGAIAKSVAAFDRIPGRVQKIEAGQPFTVIVDYAHTPDSLEKLYRVFGKSRDQQTLAPTSVIPPRMICVLGGTGGGRDTWKRSEMGRIADTYCDEIILTDEDPYDEDPRAIVEDVARGITDKKPTIIMDRRQAIRQAVKSARPGDTVLITGKGTDPYIMGAKGSKIPWSDAKVAEEELPLRKS